MSLSCGIIGLPNVGKSTIFKALTKLQVETKNFPFCTIKPNVGILPVKDRRINELNNIIKSKKITYSTIKFIDIAGLVKGSHKGEGLGNKFLDNIRNVNAIIHVVRCFQDENIFHIYSRIDPSKDIEIINMELILSDIDICNRIIKSYKKINNFLKNKINSDFSLAKKCLNHLNKFKMLNTFKINKKEKYFFKKFNFITSKSFMYIANISNDKYINNKYFKQVKNIAKKEKSYIVPIYAKNKKYNLNLIKNSENKFFLQKNNSLEKIIYYGYKLLNLQTYFTVDKKEIRSWTISKGSNVLEAAKKIHTDLYNGFIKSEVISFNDFIYYKGYNNCKKFGKIRYEGKKYLIKDGDIIRILFNI